MKIEANVDIGNVELNEEEIIYFVTDKIIEESMQRNKYVTSAVYRILEDIENPNLSLTDLAKDNFFRDNFDSITLEDLENIVRNK